MRVFFCHHCLVKLKTKFIEYFLANFLHDGYDYIDKRRSQLYKKQIGTAVVLLVTEHVCVVLNIQHQTKMSTEIFYQIRVRTI